MLLVFPATSNIFLTVLIFLTINLLQAVPAFTESSQGMSSFQNQSLRALSPSIYKPGFGREEIDLFLLRRVSKKLWPSPALRHSMAMIQTREGEPHCGTQCGSRLHCITSANIRLAQFKVRDRKSTLCQCKTCKHTWSKPGNVPICSE